MLCLLCCPQSLAVDISLAGLLGEDVYNFGELLLHPIVSGRAALSLGCVCVCVGRELLLQHRVGR